MEHRYAVVTVTLGTEEYHIIVRPVLQFLTHKLDELVFDPAAFDTGL